MNKFDEAFQKVSDRLGSEWRNHGWRKMTNEEVDADVQNALCIIEELVDRNKVLEAKAKPMKPEMIPYKGYLIEEATYQGCPSCKNPTYRDWTMFERSRLPKFCPNCGQALDWSDYE